MPRAAGQRSPSFTIGLSAKGVLSMRSQRGAVPGWLKVLLVVIVVGIVGFVGLCIFGVNMAMDAVKPGNASKVAQELVDISDPLPSGWEYLMGMNMGFAKMCSIKNAEGTAIVQLIEVPNSKNQTAEQIIDSAGANFDTPGSSTKGKFEKESQGTRVVGGKDMPYLRGKMTSKGKVAQMEMGVVILPGGKALMIQELEPEHESFDPEVTKPILDAIKGFK